MDKEQNHLIQVEIYGQSYNLRGEGEVDYIQDLAAYVDRRMREVADATATVDSLKVAILAALNIADDSRRNRTIDPSIVPGGADRVTRMIDTIDHCIGEA